MGRGLEQQEFFTTLRHSSQNKIEEVYDQGIKGYVNQTGSLCFALWSKIIHQPSGGVKAALKP